MEHWKHPKEATYKRKRRGWWRIWRNGV